MSAARYFTYRECSICDYSTDGAELIGGKFNTVQLYRLLIGAIIVFTIIGIYSPIGLLLGFGVFGLLCFLFFLSGR
jgi:hypothetical protein